MKRISLLLAFVAISSLSFAASSKTSNGKAKGKTSVTTENNPSAAANVMFDIGYMGVNLTTNCPDGSTIVAGLLVIRYDTDSGLITGLAFVASGQKCIEYAYV